MVASVAAQAIVKPHEARRIVGPDRAHVHEGDATQFERSVESLHALRRIAHGFGDITSLGRTSSVDLCHVRGPTAALTPQAAAEQHRANPATFRRSAVALRLLHRYPSSTPRRMLAKEPRMESQHLKVERFGDRLTLEGLRRHLTTDIVGHHVYLFRTVDSTNRALARLADRGASEGTVLLAEEQTAGRGRHGSAWFSPEAANLYVSVLFHPRIAPRQLPQFAPIGSLALA